MYKQTAWEGNIVKKSNENIKGINRICMCQPIAWEGNNIQSSQQPVACKGNIVKYFNKLQINWQPVAWKGNMVVVVD